MLILRVKNAAHSHSPLFVEDEYNCTPLSRDYFISLLRDLLGKLRHDVSKFCGHSFRIGAATSAAAVGVEDHVIQSLGRWASGSDLYSIYLNRS